MKAVPGVIAVMVTLSTAIYLRTHRDENGKPQERRPEMGVRTRTDIRLRHYPLGPGMILIWILGRAWVWAWRFTAGSSVWAPPPT